MESKGHANIDTEFMEKLGLCTYIWFIELRDIFQLIRKLWEQPALHYINQNLNFFLYESEDG